MLGWAFDETGPKADIFSHAIAVLGVAFDLAQSSSGRVCVMNTENKRIKELVESLQAFAASGSLSKPEALKLRGRVGFAGAQIFGRATTLALQILTEHVYASPFVPQLSDATAAALRYLADRLIQGPPRVISVSSFQTAFLFTDASFGREDGSGGIGSVLCDEQGQCRRGSH